MAGRDWLPERGMICKVPAESGSLQGQEENLLDGHGAIEAEGPPARKLRRTAQGERASKDLAGLLTGNLAVL